MQEPFWSAGHLPTFTDGAILVTNAGWKALAIGLGTTANYPDSLRLGSLTVDAPVGRVGSEFTPVGFSRVLERAILPSSDKVLAAARRVLAY